jgi:hypothetical protein
MGVGGRGGGEEGRGGGAVCQMLDVPDAQPGQC